MLPAIKLLRPQQWLKNIILFFPSFFNGSLTTDFSRPSLLLALVSFCLISSAMYIFNDLADIKEDQQHPQKRHRPLAAGIITPGSALRVAAILILLTCLTAGSLSGVFLILLAGYVIISLLYTHFLKHIAILDIICVSVGFLIRLQAGGVASHIHISEWLFISVFLLAAFLSTGKRVYEKDSLGAEAVHHRASLDLYPAGFLDGMMFITGAAVMITYSLYVITKPGLIYTLPICFFALLRYTFLAKNKVVGDPTEAILRDSPLFISSLFWAIMVAFIIYS
ncbi:MAG TPA: decaprenyl-phosphate phosphoribosyltransferase [Flammeovirgaceae bacterium]|nr:decaprenyl-phosphate phosphoribosyltransferase [Flammeovirgaceae bacterium]